MCIRDRYGPLFAELYERLVGGESLIYSWDTGLGSSFLGNFYNYLSSPLSVIILLFGHSNIPEAIATMILLKAALASAAFAYYLCLLYTSDAADDLLCVDLGSRRIIKKNKKQKKTKNKKNNTRQQKKTTT